MTWYMRKIIEIVVEVESTRVMREEQVIAFFVFLRQHLEEMQLKQSFKVATFYCNWVLHAELDRGFVQDVLKDVYYAASGQYTGHADLRFTVNDKINELISMGTLRQEIIQVLEEGGALGSRLFKSFAYWKRFLQLLEGLILYKPIKRTKPVQTGDAEQLRLTIPNPSELDQEYVREVAIENGTVFWELTCVPSGDVYFGPLAIPEPREDFEYA